MRFVRGSCLYGVGGVAACMTALHAQLGLHPIQLYVCAAQTSSLQLSIAQAAEAVVDRELLLAAVRGPLLDGGSAADASPCLVSRAFAAKCPNLALALARAGEVVVKTRCLGRRVQVYKRCRSCQEARQD